MKRSYAVYQVDAFTKEKLSGNPAGVVLDARGLTDEEMREIAALDIGHSEIIDHTDPKLVQALHGRKL